MFTSNKLVIAVLAVLALANTGNAQSFTKASTSSALARAITLHDSAVALYSQPDRATRAARFHEREADFRSPTDPEAVEALVMAGRLYAYANHSFAARKALEKAAQRALDMGDVFNAAQAYLDAAFVVQKTDHEASGFLARKAFVLSKSPLLATSQRSAIQSRIESAPSFAQSR